MKAFRTLFLSLLLAGISFGLQTCLIIASDEFAHQAGEAPKVIQEQDPAPTAPELPRTFLDTTYPMANGGPKGKTIAVPSGGDLQEALNLARPGDIIMLQAGATYIGNFVLPRKFESHWIEVRTSAADGDLPPPGVRITPEYAHLMPKIVSPNDEPALKAAGKSHHYRFIGIEFTISPDVKHSYNVILLGSDEVLDTQLPHHLIFDRVYIHGHPNTALRRGVALNSASTAIIDSYISDCHEEGADSQAIMGWNGTGPYKIVNNYLEGAGENIMFGGADPEIQDLTPSDIEIRRNYFYKPLKWRVGSTEYGGKHWSVKNLFELKNAQRVLIEGNVFENNWVDAQNGSAILFTVRNQDGGSPWSIVQDVTFINNIVLNTAGVFNFLGQDDENPSRQSSRFSISNNLFLGVDGKKWGGGTGAFLQIGAVSDVRVDHNTVQQNGSAVFADRGPSNRFIFTDNIVFHNEYGIIGDDHGVGDDTIRHYFPNGIIKKNVIIGGKSENYPADNFFPTSWSSVEFADSSGGDYRLSKSSPYKGAATDGKNIGCNLDARETIKQATAAPAARTRSVPKRPKRL